MQKIDLSEVVSILKENDNFLLLTHRNPDGDTLGSAFGLMYALRTRGKTAKVLNCDKIPEKYSYMFGEGDIGELDNPYVVALDIADESLLGPGVFEKYSGKIKLCIDHHISNKGFAEKLYLRDCAAACEIIYDILVELEIEKNKLIADCLYTGISTDTGCFKFPNVTKKTHLIAADLVDKGADITNINRLMFETKPKGYYYLASEALSTLKLYFDGKCAMMYITQEMLAKTNTDESDCDGLSSIPRRIEGVLVGVTARERSDGSFKVSLRSHAPVDVSKICGIMGGGGHARAAGCELDGKNIEAETKKLLAVIKAELDSI
ncbi:MAG: bifunctional oligoribonuclease/PAP phosphatase NrnA [Ruminococcaceae bacterium]|nr:bifunctional oligoribonuclease/PAP phosphatase NrnA [Oscillospiraceae bacterium]